MTGEAARERLAYFWGEDAFGIERAERGFGARATPPGETLLTWRTSGEEVAVEGREATGSASRRRALLLDAIETHLGSAPLFGGGTLVVIRQPAGLLADAAARDRLLRLVAAVPPGNALCITDLVAPGARGPAAGGRLRDAVAEAGGEVAELAVPAAGRMEAWIATRARELGIGLDPAAARLLAQRVGGHVREADVDRRRRTELANAELEKLALYRPDGHVTAEDVEALVAESVPASAWAFLDALGSRSMAAAARLADGLLRETPMPVLIAQLHRRLRELILVREHLDGGARPADIVRAMRLQPFRAQKLSEQAGAWSASELDLALIELADLDVRSKGVSLDGSTLQMSDALDALALQAWLARHLAGGQPSGSREPGRRPARAGDAGPRAVRRGTASRAPG